MGDEPFQAAAASNSGVPKTVLAGETLGNATINRTDTRC